MDNSETLKIIQLPKGWVVVDVNDKEFETFILCYSHGTLKHKGSWSISDLTFESTKKRNFMKLVSDTYKIVGTSGFKLAGIKEYDYETIQNFDKIQLIEED